MKTVHNRTTYLVKTTLKYQNIELTHSINISL
jgi:hypothetical protein